MFNCMIPDTIRVKMLTALYPVNSAYEGQSYPSICNPHGEILARFRFGQPLDPAGGWNFEDNAIWAGEPFKSDHCDEDMVMLRSQDAVAWVNKNNVFVGDIEKRLHKNGLTSYYIEKFYSERANTNTDPTKITQGLGAAFASNPSEIRSPVDGKIKAIGNFIKLGLGNWPNHYVGINPVNSKPYRGRFRNRTVFPLLQQNFNGAALLTKQSVPCLAPAGVPIIDQTASCVQMDHNGDIYVAVSSYIKKYSWDGTLLWSCQTNQGVVYSITPDAGGNVLVCGGPGRDPGMTSGVENWDSLESYQVGDVVKYSITTYPPPDYQPVTYTYYYICIKDADDTIGSPNNEPTYWQEWTCAVRLVSASNGSISHRWPVTQSTARIGKKTANGWVVASEAFGRQYDDWAAGAGHVWVLNSDLTVSSFYRLADSIAPTIYGLAISSSGKIFVGHSVSQDQDGETASVHVFNNSLGVLKRYWNGQTSWNGHCRAIGCEPSDDSFVIMYHYSKLVRWSWESDLFDWIIEEEWMFGETRRIDFVNGMCVLSNNG